MQRHGGDQISVRIRPRLQKETWSLYWKESMHTDTDCLPDFSLEVEPDSTISQLQVRRLGEISGEAMEVRVAEEMGWPPLNALLRLEGFTENWQRCLHKGRELNEEKTLEESGIDDAATLTVVRKELIAEGTLYSPTPP